jgi:hypothetical protein
MPDGTAYHRHARPADTPPFSYHSNIRLLGPRPAEGQKFDNHYFPLLDNPAYDNDAKHSRA